MRPHDQLRPFVSHPEHLFHRILDPERVHSRQGSQSEGLAYQEPAFGHFALGVVHLGDEHRGLDGVDDLFRVLERDGEIPLSRAEELSGESPGERLYVGGKTGNTGCGDDPQDGEDEALGRSVLGDERRVKSVERTGIEERLGSFIKQVNPDATQISLISARMQPTRNARATHDSPTNNPPTRSSTSPTSCRPTETSCQICTQTESGSGKALPAAAVLFLLPVEVEGIVGGAPC